MKKLIEYLFLFKQLNYELEYRQKINETEYNQLLQKLKTFQFINQTQYISQLYENNKRIKIMNNNEIYEEKINICDLFLDTGKITLSIETQVNEKPIGTIIEERNINRQSFRDQFNNIHEISIITKTNEIIYEYEIEYFTIPNIQTKEHKLKVYHPKFFFIFMKDNIGTFVYNNLFGRNTFIGKKPATFTRKDFDTITKNTYYVTEKIDGLHIQCIFYDDKVYILNSLLEIIDIITINYINEFIIFDAEYINNTIYLFDIIYHTDNKNVLEDKISIMNQYILNDRIKVKTFEPILTGIHDIFKRTYPYEIDGIILMPSDSNLPIYKYKKEEYQTIDFLIEISSEQLTINDFDLFDILNKYNINTYIRHYYIEREDINSKLNEYKQKQVNLSADTLQLYYNRLQIVNNVIDEYEISNNDKYKLEYRNQLINKLNTLRNNPEEIKKIKKEITNIDNILISYMENTLNELEEYFNDFRYQILMGEIESGYYTTLPHFNNPKILSPEYFEKLNWYQKLLKNFHIYSNYIENKPYNNPIWILKCGNNAFNKKLGKREYKPIIFNPERNQNLNTIGIIRSIAGDDLYSNYQTNSIIEMRWDYKKERFVPLRERKDKTTEYRKGMKQYGNDLMKTVMPLWENIQNSITIGEIWSAIEDTKKIENVYYQKKETKKEREKDIMINVRNYNNRIKSEYIEKVIQEKQKTNKKIHILDLGSGRGGDINKINKENIDYIGIENSEDNVKEANNRLSNLKNKKANIQYIVQDFTELFDLKQTFDIILCNFAIHYSFRSEQSLYNYMMNLHVHSKINTLFVITYIDGNELLFKPMNILIPNHEKIYNEKQTNTHRILAEGLVESVLDNQDIKSDFYRYEKTFMNNKINITFPLEYGNEINVYIHSIGHTIPEYIVDSEYLMFQMNTIGFTLVESNNFINISDTKNFSKDEIQFIRLHRAQIYQKNINPILKEKQFENNILDILPKNISIINEINNIYYENGVFLDKMFENVSELNLNTELILIRILFDKYTPIEQYNIIKETNQYYMVNSFGTNENGYVIVWKYNVFIEYLIEHNKEIVNIISNYRNYDIFQYEQLLFIHSPTYKINTIEILKYINNTNAVLLENNIEYVFDENYILENKDIIISPNIIIDTISKLYDRLIQLSPDRIICYGIFDDTILDFNQQSMINNELIQNYFEKNNYKLKEFYGNFINNNGLLIFHKNIQVDPILSIDFKGNVLQLNTDSILLIPIDIIDDSNYELKLFRHKKTGEIIQAYIMK
jgi:mRNA (guanine-N7-)-methyltransferase